MSAVGSFLQDGSWIDSSHHRGKVNRLVHSLVKARQMDTLSPDMAVREILEDEAQLAFPNHAQWATCSRWPLVQCSTAAEEAVKRGGSGSGSARHWCRGCWVDGPEKDCMDPVHREKPLPEEVSRLVRTLSGAFD